MRSTGAQPKPDDQKVTRHKLTVETVVLPRAGRKGAAPKPTLKLEGPALAVWRAMWKRPEATQWTLADVPALSRLVWLQCDPVAIVDGKLLAEMRQLEDRFGLNPYARKQMRWVLEEKAEPARVAAKPAGRRGLRVVDAAG